MKKVGGTVKARGGAGERRTGSSVSLSVVTVWICHERINKLRTAKKDIYLH